MMCGEGVICSVEVLSMNWRKCTVCGAIGIYGMTCVCGNYIHSKDVLEKLCFTEADCRVARDLASGGFGKSPLRDTVRAVATTSTATGAGVVAPWFGPPRSS